MLRIALTGGIGCGKTAVSDAFWQLGVPVIDTDRISHQLTAAGQPAVAEIADAFGAKLLDAHGNLDRPMLRQLVFDAPHARQKLEAILHPRIREQVARQLAQANGAYAIVVIPLLLETGQQNDFDRVLVVDCAPEKQIERVRQRSALPVKQIEQIIAAQVPRAQRLAAADDIISNDGNLAELQRQVEALDQCYRELATN